MAVLLVVVLVATPAPRLEGATPLVADLSNHLIAITTNFTGTDVLLFGAVDGPGDVVVVVRGPVTDVTVRRQEQIAGIWVNRTSVEFRSVPSFYAVASTRPIDELLDASTRMRHAIGLDTLRLSAPEADHDILPEFRDALMRIKTAQLLYRPELIDVIFLGDTLFRADIRFPSNVPIGSYVVEVLLVRDGEVASAQTTPLVIGKIGLGADIFELAHRHKFFYGLGSVLLALLAGWIAHLVFRRI
jgi:uncharacterized protein (TIGR02186 family)